MKTVRTGIVGLGYWGPQLLRNFTAQPKCTMLWGCDLEEVNIEKLKRHYPSIQFTTSFDDLINDATVELIIIATPTKAHFSLAKKALEAKKHVFIEKPMTANSKEAQELLVLAKKNKCQIFVDHTFTFTPAIEKIQELVKNNALGKLLYFDSVRINLGIIQKDTNVLWDLAIHDLSILSTFTNLDDIIDVRAHAVAHYGKHAEVAHLHLQYKNGFHAHIHVSWLSPVKIRQTILAGTKAMITYDDTEPSEKLRLYDAGVDHDTTKADPFFPKYRAGDIIIPKLRQTEALSVEASEVLESVLGNAKARSSGAMGAKIIEILEAADASLST